MIGGEILSDTNRYDLFYTYHDLCDKRRRHGLHDNDLTKYGISTEGARKHRAGAADKDGSYAEGVVVAKTYGDNYRIPLDHPILKDHGVFSPRGLRNQLTFEITMAPVNEVVVFSDTTKPPNYIIGNMELEYVSVTNSELANSCLSTYRIGKAFQYENVHLHQTFTMSKSMDSIVNLQVDVPRRSMSGIMILFTDEYNPGTRDSEKFANVGITSVTIDIDGVPNRIYSKGMLPTDFWESVGKRMGGVDESSIVRVGTFYGGSKFALWLDLRTFSNNELHGEGLRTTDAKNGVRLQLRRSTGESGNFVGRVFVVADAQLEVMNGNLTGIIY